MGHMVASLMVGTIQTRMAQSKMAGSWIHLIEEAVDMASTLVMVQTSVMVIIAIILIGGLTKDICQMSSRKQRNLHSMDN